MKTQFYRIIKTRDNDITERYLIVTDEDNLISDLLDPETGEPYFGSWTDDKQSYEDDSDITLFVEDIEKK